MNVYQQHGFNNRREYLESLADDVPLHVVLSLADVLGEAEDFDGLVTELEDLSDLDDFNC
jgi:hypothetical protein